MSFSKEREYIQIRISLNLSSKYVSYWIEAVYPDEVSRFPANMQDSTDINVNEFFFLDVFQIVKMIVCNVNLSVSEFIESTVGNVKLVKVCKAKSFAVISQRVNHFPAFQCILLLSLGHMGIIFLQWQCNLCSVQRDFKITHCYNGFVFHKIIVIMVLFFIKLLL